MYFINSHHSLQLNSNDCTQFIEPFTTRVQAPLQKALWSLRLWWDLIAPSFPGGETSQRTFRDFTNSKYSRFLSFVVLSGNPAFSSQNNLGTLMFPEDGVPDSNGSVAPPKSRLSYFFFFALGYSPSLQGSHGSGSSGQLVPSAHSRQQRGDCPCSVLI